MGWVAVHRELDVIIKMDCNDYVAVHSELDVGDERGTLGGGAREGLLVDYGEQDASDGHIHGRLLDSIKYHDIRSGAMMNGTLDASNKKDIWGDEDAVARAQVLDVPDGQPRLGIQGEDDEEDAHPHGGGGHMWLGGQRPVRGRHWTCPQMLLQTMWLT